MKLPTKANTSDSWIKLCRQVLKNGWLRNHWLCAFWCYCLFMPNKIEQLKQKRASPFVFQVNSGEGDGRRAIHIYVLPLNPENYQI